MKRKALSYVLRAIAVFIAMVVVGCFAFFFPFMIYASARNFPEFAWLADLSVVAVSLAALPILVALGALWRLCGNIARGTAFSRSSVRSLNAIGICAATDTVYAFVYSIFLYFVGAFNPPVFFFVWIVVVFGTTVSVVSFLVAHLADNAVSLQEEIEYTV